MPQKKVFCFYYKRDFFIYLFILLYSFQVQFIFGDEIRDPVVTVIASVKIEILPLSKPEVSLCDL